MSDLAARQALLARFLDDPALEARVRAVPSEVAREEELDPSYVAKLAAIPEMRVAAFRRSRAHKDEVRRGKRPSRI